MMILKLKYDGVWIASGKVSAKGESLEELDRNLAEELRKIGLEGRVEVLMKFDISTIPDWMRQFHQHYFNRKVVFDL